MAKNTQAQTPQEGVTPYVYVYERAAVVYYVNENFDMYIYFAEPIPEEARKDTAEALLSIIDNYTVDGIVITTVNGVEVMTINRTVRYTYSYRDEQLVKVPYAEDISNVTLHLGGEDRTYELPDDNVMDMLRAVIEGELTVKEFAEEVTKTVLSETEQITERFLDRLFDLNA